MIWVTENPELFILGVIAALLAVVVWRLWTDKNTVSEPAKQLEKEIDPPLPPQESAPKSLVEVPNEVHSDSLVDKDKRTEENEAVETAAPIIVDDAELAHEELSESKAEEVSTASDDVEATIETAAPKRNFFIAALKRSRDVLKGGFSALWSGQPLDEEALEDLEDTLIRADVGAQVAMEMIEDLQDKVESGADGEALKAHLRALLLERIGESQPINSVADGPLVILVVGVNGSGKTTTIGKLSHRYIQAGQKVMVAAGDTFRAGAIEQLKVWAERSGAEFISSQPKADPASVVYTALEAAIARNMDVVICDTAGRLQAQSSLMEELTKVAKVGKKLIPSAPHEVLLVLDATIGQNALSQAEGFNEAADLTGVVLTKLDGTAKGGVVVAVQKKLGIPVKLVGLGEGIDDLRDFSPEDFVDALLLSEEEV